MLDHTTIVQRGARLPQKGYRRNIAMGFYATHIFSRLMDRVMGRREFHQLRADLLKSAQGEVLEIGLGTGPNLACYPPGILRLRAVDPTPLLPKRVATRCAAASFPVELDRKSTRLNSSHT